MPSTFYVTIFLSYRDYCLGHIHKVNLCPGCGCVLSLLTATGLNVSVLTGGVLMQKVQKTLLNSLEEHSACTPSTGVRISIPAASAQSCFNCRF